MSGRPQYADLSGARTSITQLETPVSALLYGAGLRVERRIASKRLCDEVHEPPRSPRSNRFAAYTKWMGTGDP